MPSESNSTDAPPAGEDPPTQTHHSPQNSGGTASFAAAATPGGWSQPPKLRQDPLEQDPAVVPFTEPMPIGARDRYQIEGEIARGGMGVILRGYDPDLGRVLAIKVLKVDLAAKPSTVQRFVDEAQICGQLQHPGIVPVYDIGRFDDGRPYFAMKLVKGRTLADILDERTNPTAERGRFIGLFQQICQAVAYAHSKGVIHRDLKPSNIMVGAFGEVMVMDWGLAKVLTRDAVAADSTDPDDERTGIHTARFDAGHETLAGSVLGTPAFMPPEQARGEIDKMDERADVFGLGAILCVILTGRPPYNANSFEAVWWMAKQGQLTDAYVRLDQFGIDGEIRDLCKRCLTADRDDRPTDARELSAKLADYLSRQEERIKQAELSRAAATARSAEKSQTQESVDHMEARLAEMERELVDNENERQHLKRQHRRNLRSLVMLGLIFIMTLVALMCFQQWTRKGYASIQSKDGRMGGSIVRR